MAVGVAESNPDVGIFILVQSLHGPKESIPVHSAHIPRCKFAVCTYMGIRYPGSLPRVAEIFLDAVDRVSVRHACGMSHLVVAYYEDMTDPRWPQQTAAAVNGRAFRTRGRWVRLRVGLPLHCCCCA